MAEGSVPREVQIDEALTRRVADLARLELTDDEARTFTQQIRAILGYVGQLQALDVSGVEPLRHPFESATPLREDEVVVSPPNPLGEGGYKVPQIL